MRQKTNKNSLSFDLNDIMLKDLVLLSLEDLDLVGTNDLKDVCRSMEDFLQLINRPDIVLACVSKTLRNKVKRDNLVLRTCYNIQNKYIFLKSGSFKVYCYYISSLALEF
jgi:hypothetical protein